MYTNNRSICEEL